MEKDKTKNFCTKKRNDQSGGEKQLTEWEIIFENNIFDK